MNKYDNSSEVYLYLLGAKSFYTIVSLCGAVGAMCNSVLLFTTIRTTSLRSPCNILIGACALFDIVHELGAFLVIIQLYRDELTSSLICSSLLFLPEMGIAAGAFTVLSIGVDRFFNIAIPNRYRAMNKAIYLTVVYIRPPIFSDLICDVPAVFHGNGVVWWAYSGAAVHALAFVVYLLTWRLIKAQGKQKTSENIEVEELAHIFRTILLVTILELGGFALTQILMATQDLIDMPDPKHIFCKGFAAIFVNLGIADKVFVYYFTSSEYRFAIGNLIHNRKNNVISLLSCSYRSLTSN